MGEARGQVQSLIRSAVYRWNSSYDRGYLRECRISILWIITCMSVGKLVSLSWRVSCTSQSCWRWLRWWCGRCTRSILDERHSSAHVSRERAIARQIIFRASARQIARDNCWFVTGFLYSRESGSILSCVGGVLYYWFSHLLHLSDDISLLLCDSFLLGRTMWRVKRLLMPSARDAFTSFGIDLLKTHDLWGSFVAAKYRFALSSYAIPAVRAFKLSAR